MKVNFAGMMKRYRMALIITAIAGSSILSYSFVDNYFEISKNLDIFNTLFRELNIYYVDETDPGILLKKGVDSMLESLDPYTNFISESEIEDYRFMTTGQYGGIGAVIQQKGDYVVIKEPYENSPAIKSDLRAGDVIVEVDGKSSKGKKTDEVSKILKGQPKTPVTLTIQREGEKNNITRNIVREEIKVKNVPYYGTVENSIGYIRLTGFTENASREVRDAFLNLKEKENIQGLILDLRGNPGGLLNEAVNIVNLFTNKGQEIVSTRGKVKEWDKSYKALNAPVDTEIPVVVIVNSGSASASEIVSGALQDLDRGVVIGQRTFGKGLVQTTRPLSYNAQLKITTAKYYIPSGRCIQAIDYSHRNEDGSVGKIPDSLVTMFKTKNGRPVHDGGGVRPDISLEPQKLSSISQGLFNKMMIFDFATLYRNKNASIATAGKFNISDSDYTEFTDFVNSKEFDYSTKSEKALEDLKKAAENEKYYEAATTEFEALKTKLMHNKKEDLIKFRPEISTFLKEEIVSRYYLQSGRIESSFSTDPEIKEAIDVLRDRSTYSAVVSGTYKSKK